MKKLLIFSLVGAFAFSSPVFAGGKGKGGDDFRKAAIEYDAKAADAAKNGKADHTKVYKRLAQIKRTAGMHADKGEWDKVDWTEYKQLQKSLYGDHKKHDKKHDK